MNNEVKVNLTVILKGRVMVSEQVAQNKPENYDLFSMELYDKSRNKRDIIKVRTRKCIPAKQTINLSVDAYNTMIDRKECPYWFGKPKDWANLSNKQRLEAHLKDITESLGGVSYSYVVFEK